MVKVIDFNETTTSQNFLPALLVLIQCTIDSTNEVITHYQNSSLFLKPTHYISFYYGWLEFVVHQKVIGDKENLIRLIRDTIELNTIQGKNLYELIEHYTGQESEQVDHLVKSQGVIVVAVLKLIQYISDRINLAMREKSHLTDQNENIKLVALTDKCFIDSFNHNFYASLEAVKALQVTNPLIFTLENFSAILGWTIGFFSHVYKKPMEVFLDKNDFGWLVSHV